MNRLDQEKSRHDRAKIVKWLEGQRGRPQFRPTPKASSAVNKVVGPLTKKMGGSTAPLRPYWAQIMGSRLARITRPLNYASGARGRTLIIEAPTAASAMITSNAPRILARIEDCLGPHNIAHIRVRAGRNREHDHATKTYSRPARGLTPSEAKELEHSLEDLKHKALKPTLQKLGQALFTQNPDNKTSK